METPDWVSLGDEELLERRISKLGLKLEGTVLQPLIKQLYDELSAKGLRFHPPCYVGDEWSCRSDDGDTRALSELPVDLFTTEHTESTEEK